MVKGPEPANLKSFVIELGSLSARYVKVAIEGTLKNPDWHPAPGAKSWVFVDEILVD